MLSARKISSTLLRRALVAMFAALALVVVGVVPAYAAGTPHLIAGHVDIKVAGTSAAAGQIRVELHTNLSTPAIATALTDASGNYDLGMHDDDVALYLEFVSVAPSPIPAWYFSGIGNVGARHYLSAVALSYPVSDQRFDVVFGGGAGISGHVVDSNGDPVAGITVQTAGVDPTGVPGSNYEVGLTTTSGADGSYEFAGLPPQWEYSVTFYADGYSYHSWPGPAAWDPRGTLDLTDNVMHTGIDTTMYVETTLDVNFYAVGWYEPSAMQLRLRYFNEVTEEWEGYSDFVTDYAFEHLIPGYYVVFARYAGTRGTAFEDSGVFYLEEGLDYEYAISFVEADLNDKVAQRYAELDGSIGPLGAPTSPIGSYASGGGGSLRHYEGGSIYSSTLWGTYVVWASPLRDAYFAAGSVGGAYGWPKADETCNLSGLCSQVFAGGTITETQLALVTAPTVPGTPLIGTAVTATNGTYTPAATSYTYRWFRNGSLIPGATTNKYTPVTGDFGQTLQVEVTAKRVGSYPVVALSAVSAAVAKAAIPTVGTPGISGVAKVGASMTAVPGSWTPQTTFTYQWKAAGVDIAGAVNPTFTPTTAEFGKAITVVVTGNNPSYSSVTRTSGGTAAVAAGAFAIAPVPTLSGTPQVGQTLTAAPGVWDPAATFIYRWYANGVLIPNAIDPTYTPSAAQVGKRITVVVTGTAFGYANTAKTSVATAPVLPLVPTYPRDLDGDAWPDIAFRAGVDGPLSVAYLAGGGPAIKSTTPYGVAGPTGYQVFSGSDFITGGPSEMLAYKSGEGFYLWEPAGLGAVVYTEPVASGYNVVLGVGDWNRDGKADILARTPNGDMYLLAGNGVGGAAAPVKIGQGWAPYSVLGAVGNMAGDGGADIIARDSTGVLWLYPSAVSASTFGTRARIGAGWNAMTAMFGVGDLTGDTRDDLLGRDSTGKLWLYPGLGNATYSPRVQIPGAWAPAQFLG